MDCDKAAGPAGESQAALMLVCKKSMGVLQGDTGTAQTDDHTYFFWSFVSLSSLDCQLFRAGSAAFIWRSMPEDSDLGEMSSCNQQPR